MDFLDFPPSTLASHSFTLHAMAKFTSYQVVVTANNAEGEGPASTAMVATTLEDGMSVHM